MVVKKIGVGEELTPLSRELCEVVVFEEKVTQAPAGRTEVILFGSKLLVDGAMVIVWFLIIRSVVFTRFILGLCHPSYSRLNCLLLHLWPCFLFSLGRSVDVVAQMFLNRQLVTLLVLLLL